MQYATEPFLRQKCQRQHLVPWFQRAFLFCSKHQRQINKPNLPNNIKNSNIHHQKKCLYTAESKYKKFKKCSVNS